MARVLGGLLGWIASITPLIAVNISGAIGLLSWDDAFIASAVALLVGPALGGLVAGYVAGHPARSSTSGARSASLAGGLAALLYFASVLGLVVYALRPETIPATVAEHPLRAALAVLCLAILALSALAVAFALGAWFDRRADGVAYATHPAAAERDARASRPAAPGSSLRDWRERVQSAQTQARGDYPSGPRRPEDAAESRRENWRSR